MNRLGKFTIIAGCAALAACGKSNNSAGENVAQAYDNSADQLDAAADNTSNSVREETLENQADALRETGEKKGEAIDEAGGNAAAVNQATANAM